MNKKLTKERQAKKLPIAVILAVVASVVLGNPLHRGLRQFYAQIEMDYRSIDIFIWTDILLTVIIVLAVISATIIVHSIFTGRALVVNDDFVMDYHILESYQLPHFSIRSDPAKRSQTICLCLVVDSYELEECLPLRQRKRLWLAGYAILPIKLAIPGQANRTLCICRSTLRRILRNVKPARECTTYIQLRFELEDTRPAREVYSQDYNLLSEWDISAIEENSPRDASGLEVLGINGTCLITQSQLKHYRRIITDAHQIVDLDDPH